MKPGGLFWRVLATNAVLLAAALAALTWMIAKDQASRRNADLDQLLAAEVDLFTRLLEPNVAAGDAAHLAEQIGRMASPAVETFLTSADGAALADFAPSLSAAEKQHLRRTAGNQLFTLETSAGKLVRVGHRHLRNKAGKQVAQLFVLRPAVPPEDARSVLGRVGLSAVGIVMVASGLMALALIRIWSRPLQSIIRTAKSLSRGEISEGVTIDGSDELALLGRSLNRMRERMVRHYHAMDRQRRMLESLLTQLREGVVVADAAGRVVLINPSAFRLLNLPAEPPIEAIMGMAVERCVPQHLLQCMLLPASQLGGADSVSTMGETIEERLTVDGPDGPIYLLARACGLLLIESDSPGGAPHVGRLLVLTDITALARTIQVRADFVANASHELRTPLSAIRGAIETLQRMNLAEDIDAAPRFIAMIDRQSSRLEALVKDLLDLARVENPAGRFKPVSLPLRELIDDILLPFSERIEARGIHIQIDVKRWRLPHIVVNAHLLRLALDNLVDNAIKFSDQDGTVRISCWPVDGAIAIQVADEGCGIPEEDQERVFERFYQVERARSGQERGTGLGLSIVRHAVMAMDGDLMLESRPGTGTRVTITIPQPSAEQARAMAQRAVTAPSLGEN